MVSDFNKKGNSKFFNNNLLYKIGGVFILFFIVFMVFEDIKIYNKKQELISQINIYKKQIEELKNSSKNLQNEIANSDSVDYLEKLGYEQFGQTKPGETEYMFVKTPKKPEGYVVSKNPWEVFTAWFSGIWSKPKN